MGDLISRSALIAEINRIGGHWHSDWETAGVLEMAHRIPAVDAVQCLKVVEQYVNDTGAKILVHRAWDASFQKLADKYGVSKKTMQNAINGVTWKCVSYMPEPPKEGE